MGLDLPSPLETILNDLGFTWPEVDEQQLFEVGSSWMQFGSTLDGLRQTADQAATSLASQNQGEAIEAFIKKYSGDQAPSHVLAQAAIGTEVGGGAILMCAGLVLGLKINTIVNVSILAVEIAEAIATAVPTFGASLLEIPVFKEITSRIIQAIINEAVNAIMS